MSSSATIPRGSYAPVVAQPKQVVLKKWGSLDTSANRQAIKENDFAWIENFIQVGDANMQSLDGPSASLASTSGGDSIYVQFNSNLNGTDTIFAICTNGAGYAFKTGAGTITKFANAGTFDGSGEAFAMWQNSWALFVGPTTGYWAYNGTTLVNLSSTTTFTITGSVTANVLTVTASPAGFLLSPGMTLSGGTITGTPTILSYGTGTGGNGTVNSANGTYNITTPNAASSTITVTQSAPGTNIAGTGIATYAGRVWICAGRTIYWSAPGSFTDFTVGDAGGAFIVSDQALYGNITAFIATNDYLYFCGLDSINIISDVRIGTSTQIVGGSTTTATVTLFNNTNITTNIGVPFNNGVAGYLRSLVFLTQRGPYILSGASPQKLGNNLDGLVPLVDFTKPVFCGICQVNIGSTLPGPAQNIIMWGVTYKDPVNGPRFIFLSFFDGKWFLASTVGCSSPVTLTSSVSAFYNNIPCLYGSDGTNIYRLFVNDSNVPTGTFITTLDSKNDPIIDKQVMKLGLEVAVAGSSNASFSVSVDTERATGASFNLFNSGAATTWLTSGLAVSTWTTSGAVLSSWVGPGFGKIYSDATAIGKYFGFTIVNNNNPDVTFNGVLAEYIERARW